MEWYIIILELCQLVLGGTCSCVKVCPSVREDNPRALAPRLSPGQAGKL